MRHWNLITELSNKWTRVVVNSKWTFPDQVEQWQIKKKKKHRIQQLECFKISQQLVDWSERTLKQTIEMIQCIINCYFQTIQLENGMTAYKQAICQHFITRHPKLTTQPTKQNVVDWDRSLWRGKLLSSQNKYYYMWHFRMVRLWKNSRWNNPY